jgi:PhnO protein
MLIIREATADDVVDINHINKLGLGYNFPLDKTVFQLGKILAMSTHKIFVAALDGTVAGYIHLRDYECTYAVSYKEILSIAVLPEHQGKGVGRALLEAGENWARKCGSCGIRLVSGTQREGAHKFYTACGYVSTKDQKNFKKVFGG